MYKVRDLVFRSPKKSHDGIRRAVSTRCRERVEWVAEECGLAHDDDHHPLRSATAVEVWRAFGGNDLFGPTDPPEEEEEEEEETSNNSSSSLVVAQQLPVLSMSDLPRDDDAHPFAATPLGQLAGVGDSAPGDAVSDGPAVDRAVTQLEEQWRERQQRQQVQLNVLRAKERQMELELAELKCHYREDFARLTHQKDEALESQQRLLRLAGDQDHKIQRQAQRLEEQESQLRQQATQLAGQEQQLALQGERLSQKMDTAVQLQSAAATEAWRALQLAMEEKCAEWHSEQTLRQQQRAEYYAELLQTQSRELAALKQRLTVASSQSAEAISQREDLALQVCRLTAQLASHREASVMLQDGLRGQLELLQSHNDRLQHLALEKHSHADRLQAELAALSRVHPTCPSPDTSALLAISDQRSSNPSLSSADGPKLTPSPVASPHSPAEGSDVLLRQLDALQRYNADLTQRLAAAEDREERLHQEKQQLALEVAQLRTSRETEGSTLEELRSSLAALRTECAAEAAARETAQHALEHTEQELQELRQLHARCPGEQTEVFDAVTTLKASLATTEAALESRSREVQRLRLLQQCTTQRRLREAHALAGSHSLTCSHDALSGHSSPSVSPFAGDWVNL
eukprot:GGOE01001863.1.p1 GENE.GGOE01001863.1~~GGOE01001863.1.p1  ORF type:complete len:630 (-),score=193.07 GGOE01001863.1:490-2379(-)